MTDENTAVIQQELHNISVQLTEMQATLQMWLSHQQKKTATSRKKLETSPYAWPCLKRG